MSGGGATDIEEEELAMAETGAAPSLDKKVAVITGDRAAVVLSGKSQDKGQLLFFDVCCSATAHGSISFWTRWKC